jgi:hypothetical protein
MFLGVTDDSAHNAEGVERHVIRWRLGSTVKRV